MISMFKLIFKKKGWQEIIDRLYIVSFYFQSIVHFVQMNACFLHYWMTLCGQTSATNILITKLMHKHEWDYQSIIWWTLNVVRLCTRNQIAHIINCSELDGRSSIFKIVCMFLFVCLHSMLSLNWQPRTEYWLLKWMLQFFPSS